MHWDPEAEKAHESLPIPPIMAPYARLYSEKVARARRLDRITADVVAETARVYADFVGKEKTAQFRAFIDGTGPAPELEEELFFQNDQALYHLDVCFTKYGENSQLVRDALKDMMRSIIKLMEQENLTELMADRACIALHGASRFTVGMTGCSNCCVSPYMKDFGIIMRHYVDITAAACTLCGECLKLCVEKSISLSGEGPVIDRATCVHCELCARDCPTGKLQVHKRGWKVIAGGGSGHHPTVAVTIEDFVTKDRVLTLLSNAIARLRSAPPDESLRTIIAREGPQAIC